MGGAARRSSGGRRGGGWGLCVAAVAGCGAAGRFRRLGFGARGRAGALVYHHDGEVSTWRRSGGGRGGGWGLCVAAVAGCGAAGRFRRLGFGARSHAAVAPITVLALASHALGRGTVRCRAGTRRRWGGGMRGPGSSGRGWRALGCTRCLRGRGGGASTSGLRCRVSEGRSDSGCPGRRTQGRWAYACRAQSPRSPR